MNNALRAAAFLAVALVPDAVLACVCSHEARGLRAEFHSSAAVFVGRIVALSLEEVPLGDGTGELMVGTFVVERRWKGPQTTKLNVRTCGTPVLSCSCGVEFKLGQRYLVFASGERLSTSSCNRTRVASDAEALIEELDELSPVAEGRTTTR